MAEKVIMLTTVDNPWDPVDNFDSWLQFDTEKGYNSCAMLAKIAKTSDQMSPREYTNELEHAIDDIVKYDFMHVYKKYVREVG